MDDQQPVAYAAYVIDAASRGLLLQKFPPKYPDVVAHHVTHKYPAMPADVPRPPLHVRVTGYHNCGAIEVLVVMVDGRRQQVLREDETPRWYHITLSLDRAKGVEPKNSNDVLAAIVAKRGEVALDNLAAPFAISVMPQLLEEGQREGAARLNRWRYLSMIWRKVLALSRTLSREGGRGD
ncbi:MAG TPA: hypothetical protein VEF76_03920 [Patescibacteria group bacterium]|nr:hypothetical protein [Patescibacteria group bacterium]